MQIFQLLNTVANKACRNYKKVIENSWVIFLCYSISRVKNLPHVSVIYNIPRFSLKIFLWCHNLFFNLIMITSEENANPLWMIPPKYWGLESSSVGKDVSFWWTASWAPVHSALQKEGQQLSRLHQQEQSQYIEGSDYSLLKSCETIKAQVEHCVWFWPERLPGEVVDALLWETFKIRLDRALNNLI